MDVHARQLQCMVQVVDLKDQLRERGLKTSGLKQELQLRLMDSLQHDAEAADVLPGGTGSNGTAFTANGFGQAAGIGNAAGLHTSTQHSATATQTHTAPAVKKPKLSKGKTTTKKVGPLPCAAACWWHGHVMKPDSVRCIETNRVCPISMLDTNSVCLCLNNCSDVAVNQEVRRYQRCSSCCGRRCCLQPSPTCQGQAAEAAPTGDVEHPRGDDAGAQPQV